ncbi:helix-turn-helix domain-containing protein [Rhodococcus hoagii]|uniref:Helix-turn-helix domain-containing protein n=1 Tax=Rhodococcus hoagii TaxID=43767 RepID=A0A9Q4ZIG8_RHOHA|nr:helix-turn-helix domain-containing protein [Prescottella equi]NKT77229.1 helix-turn-helix domain-containing protein [Prescottella equi]NKZ81013.1 helix-turn-helix domain-containing protein [Prescottella equi]
MAAYTSEQHKDAREFVEWIGKAISPDGEASDTEIAKATGTSQSNINRYRSGLTAPTIGIIRRMCEALDLPVLIGFVKAGLLSEEEAAVEIHSTPIASFSTSDLLAELQRRT